MAMYRLYWYSEGSFTYHENNDLDLSYCGHCKVLGVDSKSTTINGKSLQIQKGRIRMDVKQ